MRGCDHNLTFYRQPDSHLDRINQPAKHGERSVRQHQYNGPEEQSYQMANTDVFTDGLISAQPIYLQISYLVPNKPELTTSGL